MSNNLRSTRRMKMLRAEFREQCKAANLPCWLCAQEVDYEAAYDDYGNDDRFQLDHYYPVSTHPELAEDPAGFRASHASCNEARGNEAPMPGLGTLSRAW